MKNIRLFAILTSVVFPILIFVQDTKAQVVDDPNDIAGIVRYFASENREKRRKAAQLATQLPDLRLLNALQFSLSDKDAVVRQLTAQAIRSIPDPRIDQLALQWLKKGDVVVRREIIRRFEGRDSPVAVTAIEGHVNDTHHDVRQQAARILYENPHENAAAALWRVLEHKDPKVRFYAIARLEKGPSAKAIPPLKAHLNDDDQEVRHRALQSLRQLADRSAVNVVLATIKHRDHAMRYSAVDHFNNSAHLERTPNAVEALGGALSDSHNSVRQRAAIALRASKEERATSILLGALRHADPEIRRQVVSRLVDFPNPRYINQLVASLNDNDLTVRTLAVQALSRIDDPRAKGAAKAAMAREHKVDWNRVVSVAKTPGQLQQLFSHRDNEVRRRAAEKLRRLKHDDATQVALSSLNNADPEIRRQLVERLREKRHAASVPHLRRILNDTDHNVRQHAVNALKSIPGDESVQASLAAFGHKDPLVRRRVVERFRDQPDARAVPFLIRAMNDWDQHVRRESAQALRRIDDSTALNGALSAFEHIDVEVRNHVISRFAEKPDARAIPALSKVLSQGDSRNWNSAANAIRKIDHESATQTALALFQHSDAGVRKHVVARFQEQIDSRATSSLSRALHDRDLDVCRQAASSLRKTPGEAVTQVALAAFGHSDGGVRLQVVYRFVELPDPRATSKLIQKLQDTNAEVRRHAVMAIERSAAANVSGPLVPLLFHRDAKLRGVIAAKLKPIIVDPKQLAASPLSKLRVIERLKLQPKVAIDASAPFIEMIGGDRIVADVVGGARSSKHNKMLLIKPARLIPKPYFSSLPQASVTAIKEAGMGETRIYTRWIRRVVWQAQGRRFSPGVVFLRNGGQVRFRSVNWLADKITIFRKNGHQHISFAEIAELHLPSRDPFVAYCEQLAVMDCKVVDKLLRLDCSDGSRITVGLARYTPYFDVESANPDEWRSLLHPAWSVDRFTTPHRTLHLRSLLSVTELPLVQPRDSTSVPGELWPWKVDRNLKSGCLANGVRQYGWGFGVHATNQLQFQLSPLVTGVRTKVGLDKIVGNGGCARGIVRIRNGDKTADLYRGPLMIGSKDVLDTGVLRLPPFDRKAHLELIADSASREFPLGADALNVRDFVDWFEPIYVLDSERVSAAIARTTSRAKTAPESPVTP